MRIPGLSFIDSPPSIYQSSQVVVQGYPSLFTFKKHSYVIYHSNQPFGSHLLICLSSIWKDSLILPPVFATISLLILTIQFISTRKPVKKAWARFTKNPIEEEESEPNVATRPIGYVAEFRYHAKSFGGLGIFVYRVLRLLSVLALVCLSVATFVLDEAPSTGANTTTRGKHWGKKHKHHRGGSALTYWEWLDLALSLAYVSYRRTTTLNTC